MTWKIPACLIVSSVLALAGCGSVVGVDDDIEPEGGTTTTGDTLTTTAGPSSSPSTSAGPSTSPSTSAGPGPNDTSETSPSGTSPMTTPMTVSSSGGSSDGSDSSDFIVVPDMIGGCCDCDIWAQDCPEGDKCTAWANDGGDFWNSTRCSEIVPGPDQVGDPCSIEGSAVSGFDTCALGTICFNVDPQTLTGTCVAHCDGNESNPSCAPNTQCVIANEGALPLCLDLCDPLLQDCAPGLACYGFGEPGNSDDPTVCMREDSGILTPPGGLPAFCPLGSTGIPSSYIAACSDDEPCCATWCSYADLESCPDGLICEPWRPKGVDPPGFSPVGVCIDG